MPLGTFICIYPCVHACEYHKRPIIVLRAFTVHSCVSSCSRRDYSSKWNVLNIDHARTTRKIENLKFSILIFTPIYPFASQNHIIVLYWISWIANISSLFMNQLIRASLWIDHNYFKSQWIAFIVFITTIRLHRTAVRMTDLRETDALRSVLPNEGRTKYGVTARRVVRQAHAARDSRIGRKLRIAGKRQTGSRVWEAWNNPTCKLKPVAGSLSGIGHR